MFHRWNFVIGPAVAVALLGAAPTVAAQSPERPRVFLDTTYVAPTGRQTSVPAGGDLQGALDAAQPGDAIVLQAGATYTGNFTLPAKSGSGWIHVRSSALSSLPAAGARVGPAQAGLMPKIVSPNTAPAIGTAAGAHHFRFVGVEITTTWASTSATNFGLVSLEAPNGNTTLAQAPTDIVFDRCYIHGTPTGNVRRGISHEQRADGDRGLVPVQSARGRRRQPGDRGLERPRTVQDREQLSGGRRRKRHVRRRGSAHPEPGAVRHRAPEEPSLQAALVAGRQRQLRRHPLGGQEPVRAEERPACADRRQRLREQLGGRPERLRHPLHPAQSGRHGPMVGRARRDVHEQHRAS